MHATKIIFWILFVLAMVLITGDWLLQRVFQEKVPRVDMSSVSPDGRWICAIIDIHPNRFVNMGMVYVGRNEGLGSQPRGLGGEAYVVDMDSEYPSDKTEFIWEGSVVTVRNMHVDRFVKVKVGELGSEIVDSSERQWRANKGK
jgi:hypothetical protein